ncbi:MAG: site-specific tyrosine recombinase XerD [Promicromonosporaceae bacterium]|nr:site-specific tyrosine recombinase XerD [Promicromonosporaceae bacterium]
MHVTSAASPLAPQLGQYLAHLQIERGLAANTVAAYRRDLERYVAHLDGLEKCTLAEVSEANVADYLAVIREGTDGGKPLSVASATRALAAVRGWHKFAQAEGVALKDPAAAIRPPAKPRLLPKALTVEQIAALLDATCVGDDPVSLRDHALLELLYSTGGRISEIVGLDVDALGWLGLGHAAEGEAIERHSVVRLHGKGDKQRIVPVGSYARDALDAYLVRARPVLAARGIGTPVLFLNTRGKPLSRQSAWGVIQAAAERASLADVSPHTLRHSFATHLLNGGADVRVVQELLGHASVTTTQIYTMVTAQTLREVYAASHPRAR